MLDADLLSLFYSISDAIDYAHRHGLLHRDIKPANILLDQRNTVRNAMGEPILTDFGIVKIMGSAAGTLTSSSMGTPLYISPEQAQGHPDTAASDIYSLGVVLYEACTGRPPFRGESPFAILQQHIMTLPPLPEQFNPAISPALSAVIMRSLAKNPEERYPSAMALMGTLAVALNLTPPDRRAMPISSPDIRLLPDFNDSDEPTQSLGRSVTSAPAVQHPLTPLPAVANPLTPAPDAFETLASSQASLTPTPGAFETLDADQVPTVISPEPGQFAQPLSSVVPPVSKSPEVSQPAPPSPYTQAPQMLPPETPSRPARKWRGWMTVLSVLLIIVLAGSGLAVFRALQTNSATATVVGQAFFLSTGDGIGARNQGLNRYA